MNWLDRLFGDPFSDPAAIVFYQGSVAAMALALTLRFRRVHAGATGLQATLLADVLYCVVNGWLFGVGPLSAAGFVLLFPVGLPLALLTAAIVRIVERARRKQFNAADVF